MKTYVEKIHGIIINSKNFKTQCGLNLEQDYVTGSFYSINSVNPSEINCSVCSVRNPSLSDLIYIVKVYDEDRN